MVLLCYVFKQSLTDHNVLQPFLDVGLMTTRNVMEAGMVSTKRGPEKGIGRFHYFFFSFSLTVELITGLNQVFLIKYFPVIVTCITYIIYRALHTFLFKRFAVVQPYNKPTKFYLTSRALLWNPVKYNKPKKKEAYLIKALQKIQIKCRKIVRYAWVSCHVCGMVVKPFDNFFAAG